MENYFLVSVIILIFSVVIHEVAHGYAALMMGDRTAEYQGRLTLNPLKHLDPMGSFVLPILTSIIPGGFVFGYAKPVPYNPYNFTNKRWGEAIVAFAGPLSNILIAIVFGLFIRFYLIPNDMVSMTIGVLASSIVLTNIVLAVFNLVPIPPLDGSKILTAFLPNKFMAIRAKIESFGFLGVIVFLLFIWQFFAPIIPFMFKILTGLN